MRSDRRIREINILAAAFAAVALVLSETAPVGARPGYNSPPRIPHADTNGSCNWCHGTGGPGTANQFKSDMDAQAGDNWTMALALLDSDGDGFTNGEEVQDPTGAWSMGMANPGNGALIAFPSNIASQPPAPSMTAFNGVADSATLSGSVAVSVALSTTAGGNPIGITRVDYVVRNTGGGSTVATFSSTTAAAYGTMLDTATIPNGVYEVVATAFDKRTVAAGGPRSTAIVRTNITIANAPTITTHPFTQSVAPGGTANFTVVAGNATSFQWRKNMANLANGGNIAGATTATLTISNVAASDQGSYDVIVTNNVSSATSNAALLIASTVSETPVVSLVSRNTAGTIGDATSNFQAIDSPTARWISADGRIVLFRSNSTNLSPLDGTGLQDAYVRDRQTNTTSLVTVNVTNDGPGNQFLDMALLSGNGRYVAMKTQSTNLTNPAGPGSAQIYRRDLQTNTTIACSIPTGAFSGTFAGSPCDLFGISHDGRYVMFMSFAQNLGGTSMGQNIFIRDCDSNTILVVSRSTSSATQVCDGSAASPVMTPDGRFVAFTALSGDLVAGVTNAAQQVFRWDRDTAGGLVQLVTAPDNSTTQSVFGGAAPSLTPDGRFVVFDSLSDELVGAGNDTDSARDVFRRDMSNNRTVLVSSRFDNAAVSATGDNYTPSISADGRYVAFLSNDSNLCDPAVTPDTNTFTDVFRRDMDNTTAAKTIGVSAVSGSQTLGNGGYNGTLAPRFSEDGRYVFFESDAGNLSSITDTNGAFDLFRRDCQTNTTRLLSVESTGMSAADTGTFGSSITPDGSTVTFFTGATNLLAGGADNNGSLDVYVATFNSSPSVDLGADASIVFGSLFTRDAMFIDPNGADTFTATVDYGDGAGAQPLTLNNRSFTLSVNYATRGAKTVTVTVTDNNGAGGSDTLTLNVSTPPQLTSDPTANPNPTLVGLNVLFNAAASDADNDPLTFTWDFGDGTTGTGASTTKAYATPGVYTATVTVTDGAFSASGTVSVTVNPLAEFTASKGALKFNFKKPTLNDSFSLTGKVPLGVGFNPTGKAVGISIGTFSKTATLDKKGKAGTLMKLKAKKAKTGEFTEANVSFTVTLKKETLFAAFAPFGFTNATIKNSTVGNVPVIVTIDGKQYLDMVNFSYKAMQDKAASGKLVP